MHKQISSPLGVEIIHSRPEALDIPREVSLHDWLQKPGQLDPELVAKVRDAYTDVTTVVNVRSGSGDEHHELLDLVTPHQVLAMQARIEAYLGQRLGDHLDQPARPVGYEFYISRLASYFRYTDDDITSSFGQFIDRHEDNVSPFATGPHESNSRVYATEANERIVRQLSEYYGVDWEVTLKGPTKPEPGKVSVWERGVAECQFLVLDYLRDQISKGDTSATPETLEMSVRDIETNILSILANKHLILPDVHAINPILAESLENRIQALTELTIETFSRGRGGVPRFKQQPRLARATLLATESLLQEAEHQRDLRYDEAEIPVLEP